VYSVDKLISGMSGRTRDPLMLFAFLGCWAAWAGSVLFVVRGIGPAHRSWVDSGNVEMALYNLSSAVPLLTFPTLVAVCAIGMLAGSVAWAAVTSSLLAVQLLLTLAFSILVSSPERPAVYGFASALVTGVLLVVVSSAVIRLSRAR
jgi:hypothetical protein